MAATCLALSVSALVVAYAALERSRHECPPPRVMVYERTMDPAVILETPWRSGGVMRRIRSEKHRDDGLTMEEWMLGHAQAEAGAWGIFPPEGKQPGE